MGVLQACTHLLIGVGTTISAVVLKLACCAFQWIPVGYFRGFLFSGLLDAPLLFPAQKLMPYRPCDYQWSLLICLYFGVPRDTFSPGFVGKSVGFRFCYSIALCFALGFFVEIRWVLTTILPLSFPPSHFHVFTRGLRLKGQERTGEALLMVKGERQENKSETTVCLNLCVQDTFVNTLLAQNSHKAKHNIVMQESTLCF